MSTKIHKTTTHLDFERTALECIVHAITVAIHTHGHAVIGLSGGSTPTPIYRLLKENTDIDWEKVTLFLIDERYVPAHNPDSNQFMIRESLLSAHQVPDDHIIFPDTSLPLEECIKKYDVAISTLPHIHLVILGMGDDGHIASLFPPLTKDAHGPAKVIHTTTERFKVHDRISVTLPVLQSADHRLFLITGDAKKKVLDDMLAKPLTIEKYPAMELMDGRTQWIVL